MASKIDQIKIGSTSYDIDLPVDAAPSIASLNVAGSIQAGSLTDGTTTKTMTEVLAAGGNDYDDLDNIPIINQDLEAIGFTPVEDTYYRHTGTGISLVPLSIGVNPGTLYFDTTKSISAMTTILDGIMASVTPSMDETSSKLYIFISPNTPPFSHDSDMDQAICLYWFSADAAQSMRTDGQAEPLYIVMYLDFVHEAFKVIFANAAFTAGSEISAEIDGWQPNTAQVTYDNTIAFLDGSVYIDQFVHCLGEIFHTGKIYYYHNNSYLSVPNSSIIEQNLLDKNFIPVNNTYYKNTGGVGTVNALFATGQKLADGTKVRVNTSQAAQTELVNYLEALIPPTTTQQQLSSLVVSSSLYEQQSRVFGLIMYIAPGTSSEVPNGAYTVYDSLDTHSVLFVHYIDPAPSSVTPGAEEGFHNIDADGTVTIENGFTVGTILPSAGGYSWNGTIFMPVVDNIESGKIYYYNNGVYYDLLKYPKPELMDARSFIVEPDDIKTENTLYFEYDSTDYTAKLVRKSGSYYNNSTYVIPKYTKNDADDCWYKVTAIDDYAFNTRSSLTSITLPDSIETIGSYAFSGCTSLTSINLSSSLKTIKNSAFYGCSSLTNIELPEGLEMIDDYAFSNTGLTTLKTPSTLRTIDQYAFESCLSLASIDFSEGLEEIGEYAFEFGTALTHITIPVSVITIHANAFYACSNLATIDVLRDDDSTLGTGWEASGSTVTYRRRVGSYIKSASATSSSISLVDQDGNTTTFSPAASDNYYHTPSYNSGLKIATGTGVNDLYVPTGTSSSTAALGDHSHGNITNDGKITSTAVSAATGVLVYDSSNKIQRATAADTRTIIGAGTYSKPSGGIPASDLAESYIPLSGSSAITGALAPSTNNSIDFGDSDHNWKNLFGANVYLYDRTDAYSDNPSTAGSRYISFRDKAGVDISNLYTTVGNGWNAINFKLKNKSNDTRNIEFCHDSINSQWRFCCTTTDSVDLGTSSRKWRNLYVGNDIYATNVHSNQSVYTVTGLSTVAGSSTAGAYLSVRWYKSGINGITTPYDGMKIMVKVPLAGVGTAGAMLSINGNNADDYHPLAYNINTVLTTHYAVNSYKIFTYDASATMDCYKTSNTKTTVTGVWKGESNYDSGNTKNSAGSTNSTSKLFFVGAASQTSSATTYSNASIYTENGTLYLVKTQDASGTANNKPALIVGGADTSTHIEVDCNEVMAKATGTTTADLYLNSDGGKVYLSSGGTIYANAGSFYATNVYASSDKRLKENIKPAEIDYSKVINKLQIKEFNFKADEDKKVVVGVIAQELKEILPEKYQAELVSGSEKEYYSINEGKLLYIAIGALKDEMQKTKDLEERLKKVEKLLEK